VSCREDKPVAVDPGGVGRVVFEELRPQHVRGVGHAHRHARVATVCLLHGVGSQETDGVDAELIQIARHFAPPSEKRQSRCYDPRRQVRFQNLTLAKVPPRLAGEIEPEGRIQCINKRACNLRKGLAPPG